MIRYFFLYTFLLCFLGVNAQTKASDILFSVDDEPIYSSEFLRVFNKNLDLVKDESQKNVDEYLKLFINYKLKLKEAKALGYADKASYKRELLSYKKQLAQNYLTDTKVTDALVKEAYNRISSEVKASHVLVRLPESASPQDTLKAYNDVLKLRDRVIAEGFVAVKKEVHNGKTVFAEDLGYFTGFKMVYAFENAAYSTQIGEISMPFRTRFGYHVVKVFDKRKSQGERTVAHIMIANAKAGEQENSETRINEIYTKITQGEDFESLAKQFSEDASSAKKGGELAPFSAGQLSASEFETTAFSLVNVGDISKPFKTNYGWHIVKLYNKKEISSYEDMKSELEVKVKKDSRSNLINTSIVNTLKTRYNVTDDQPALDYFESILNDLYFSGRWTLPKDFESSKPLLKIENKQVLFQDFGTYLEKTQRRASPKKVISSLVKELYATFLSAQLMQYQEDNLESENEDFANIVNEYRDGLLLFDLMETEIWNTSKKDSTQIQDFYTNNKDTYFWKQRVEASVASSAKKSTIKKVSKSLAQRKDNDAIKSDLNINDEVHVIFTTGTFNAEHQAIPKGFKFEKGISKIYKHNDAFVVVNVTNVLPKTLKTLDEARGRVISDYQTFKEVNWLKSLHEKYKVVVNDATLEKVKSQINN